MLPLVASTTVWPGFERAVALGGLDDVERQPVLDRGGRVEELALDVDRDVRRREAVDPHAGRVADRVDDALVERAAPLGPAQHAAVAAFDRHRSPPRSRSLDRAHPVTAPGLRQGVAALRQRMTGLCRAATGQPARPMFGSRTSGAAGQPEGQTDMTGLRKFLSSLAVIGSATRVAAAFDSGRAPRPARPAPARDRPAGLLWASATGEPRGGAGAAGSLIASGRCPAGWPGSPRCRRRAVARSRRRRGSGRSSRGRPAPSATPPRSPSSRCRRRSPPSPRR